MVVATAADVLVLDGQIVRHGLGAVSAIEPLAEDRLHRAEASGADVQAALAGGLQTLGSVGARQAQDAEASPEALLRMRLGREDALHQGQGGRADGCGLAQQAGRRPLGVAAVGAWHVLRDRRVPVLPRIALVAGDAGALVEQLHRLVGDAGLDHLAHQAVGHGIEMPARVDMVIQTRRQRRHSA